MKKLNYLIAGVFILSLVISCSRKDPSGAMNDPPQEVTAMEVVQKPVVFYESFPGNTVPLKEVDIHGGVAGYITGIYFMEGSPVKQGQKLYEIDRSKYEAAYEEAKANVQIANANLEKVQQDYDRYQQLSKEDAIARQKLDYAEADLRTAKMGLVAAQSELVKTKTDLDYSLITAPFDGTIGISQVKIGTLVTPGQTLLNTISSDDPMGVDVQVNEKELEHFEGFKKNTPIPGDSTFQLVLPNDSIYKYIGTISIIDRAIDPETGTIRVRLDFPNKDRSLKAGMTCKVRVRNTDKVPQIIIPMKAVTEQMSEYFVFRVNGDKAEQVRINPGQRIGDDIIVSEGLNIGDKIVINGIQKLRNGAQIKVVPEGKTGGQMGQK